jgi:type IV pilus assembly protein PilB
MAMAAGSDDARPDEQPLLGTLLVQRGLITAAQLEDALAEQHDQHRLLGEIVVTRGWLTPLGLYYALAEQRGMDVVDLDSSPADPLCARLVPEAMARRLRVLPIAEVEDGVLVAMADPSDVIAFDDLRLSVGRTVYPVLADPEQLERALNLAYNSAADAESLGLAVEEATGPADDLAVIDDLVEDAPIVKFVDLLLSRAVNERASDIHVESIADGLQVRYRIDGVLYEIMRAPRSIQAGVISRLKVMAGMDITERRVPQDGRVSMKVRGRSVELRGVTVPSVHGESVVLRILDSGGARLNIADVGFLPDALARYKAAYHRSSGGILVTGPTGSGKTTTLYATLYELIEPHRSVVTVEDPVEYRIDGIKQMQIHPKAGLTFASALRALVRADPDVILVGEIRDTETVRLVTQAVLTGHLVLSTLHTNDAASTPLRMIEMGAEPFLVTAALSCVIAQRLVRKICVHCRERYEPAEADLAAANYPSDDPRDGLVFYRAAGCTECAQTGYWGRLGLHEVMPFSEEIAQIVLARGHTSEVKRCAVEQGMVPMRADGFRKVAMGLTTVEELLRVVSD